LNGEELGRIPRDSIEEVALDDKSQITQRRAMGIEQIQSAKIRRDCPLFSSIGVKWSQVIIFLG
jgi:hypothetical protein